MSHAAPRPQDDLIRIFPGESELASRMRSFDWSTTPLGAPETWPENLRIAVGICLTSRFPLFIWWGPSLTMLYNDAYISSLGKAKHPAMLGRSGREAWSEIWPTVGPLCEHVFNTGTASWSEDLLMFFDRKLPKEEVYVTFSYGPIYGDGTVDGIFCACWETTERVVGTRRLDTLRKLGVEAAEARTVQQACAAAAAALADNPHDVPFGAIYVVKDDGASAELVALTRLPAGPSAPPPRVVRGEVDPLSPWPLASVLNGRQSAEIRRGLALPGGAWPEPSRSALVLPIRARAPGKLGGLLIAGVSPRQFVDDAYRTFFELVAGHIGTALAEATAFEAERQRAEALAELDRAKTAFFSNVTHEFRTPLTLMLGTLEEARAAVSLPAELREPLTTAHRSALRLVKLVTSLLDFAAIEAGRVEAVYEPTDLAAFTADIVSGFRPVIERAGLGLAVECPSWAKPFYVNRDMWEKIVSNLVSNAFKYTFDGQIAVALRPADHGAALTVRDTGIGIAPEHVPRVFDRFYRVPGERARSHEGAGIGLALVHELVKLHGGQITVASELDRGTTFTVTIPAGSAHLPAERVVGPQTGASMVTSAPAYTSEAAGWLPDGVDAPAPVSGGPGPTSGRILIADDNADMRDYLRRLLSRSYDVHAVADGEAALAAIRSDPPDLVIADVMMPRLDGLGLLRTLREASDTRMLPVILLSARAGEAAQIEGLAAGATDYLVKPFQARELVARVSARLEIARLTRDAFDRERRVRKALLDSMADRYYAVDAEWRCTEFNAQAEVQLRALGKDPAAMIGKVLWNEFPYLPNEASLRTTMRTRQPTQHEVYYERLGEWVQNRIDPSPDGGIVIFQRYVTKSKRLEQELRRTAGYLADAEALSHTGTWALNLTTGELFWSAEHFKIFGLDPALVTPTYEVALNGVHPDDRPLLHAAFTTAMAERKPYALNCRVVRPDGEIRHVRTLAHPVIAESGDLVEYVGTVIDMTERVRAADALRRSQEQLAQVTRVMSLGALTASLGHDLNQFVVAIVTNGSACLRWLSREAPNLDEAAAAVRRIMRDAGLIGDVIANVRAFLRKTAEPRTPVDMVDIIREVRQLVDPEADRQRIVIEEACGDTLPPVLAVRIELQQVLLNLMMNAIEAMADVSDRPRILRISCRPYDLDNISEVMVSVEDSGGGFDGIAARRLYDPFYSTKANGLGMGLSIARSIVEGHGGRLWATPNMPFGATFQFTIPTEQPS